MEGREFYKEESIPKEEINRLRHIEYPNFVSVALLDGLVLKGKSVLDSGAGPNTRLAEFISKRGGTYVPMDIRGDVLADMKEKLDKENVPFYGVRGDVKALPFADKTFDIVHQRFVLMNIVPEARTQAVEEILRVARERALLLEYNWETMKSSEQPEMLERFRDVAFRLFGRFSTDPYMGSKFDELFTAINPDLQYSLQHFQREEDAAYTPELILNLRGFQQAAQNILKDDRLSEDCERLIGDLETKPLRFAPPEIVVATVTL